MKSSRAFMAAAGALLLGCSGLGTFSPPDRPPAGAGRTPVPSAGSVPDGGPAGRWTVMFSWDCAGYSETTWILHSDGTFASPSVGQEGMWTLDGRVFELTYPFEPRTVYTGTMDPSGDYLEGTIAGKDGRRGCWNAGRTESP